MAEYGYKAFLELGSLNEQQEYYSITSIPLELDAWSYTFIRNIDNRGKIETGLKGGNITFFISGIPRIMFWEWAMETCKYLSGYIIVKNTENDTIRRLYFQDAGCISMKVRYINEGKSYMSVEIVLQAEKLYFECASKPLDNRWPEDALYKSKTLSASSIKDLEDIIKLFSGRSAVTGIVPLDGIFEMEGHSYEMATFEISFLQDTYKGRPNAEVKGGIATVGLFQLPDEFMNNWMINVDRKSGIFRFGSEEEGYGLKINYTEALCMGCHSGTDNYSDTNCVFRFNLLPQTLEIKDITFNTPYILS